MRIFIDPVPEKSPGGGADIPRRRCVSKKVLCTFFEEEGPGRVRPAKCFFDVHAAEKLEQFPEIMREMEARTGMAGQGGGRRRAVARQGRQRRHAIPGPPIFSYYFWVLL